MWLGGCSQKYTLAISVDPAGAGSVSPSGGQYDSGAEVTLTATPASGYDFDHWGGDASGANPTTTITMDSDKTVTAFFEAVPEEYTLTTYVIPAGAGSVFPSGGQYVDGTPLTLTATPAIGYAFDHWGGSISGTIPHAIIAMDSNESVTAYFSFAADILTDGTNSWRLEGTTFGGRVLETLSGPVGELVEGWVILEAEFEILSDLGLVRAWYQETFGGTTSLLEQYSLSGIPNVVVTDSDGDAYSAVVLGMSQITFIVPDDSYGFTLYFIDWEPIELDY
ncbi:MAG TPA: hypothetical protein G4N91_04185 [Dehalococcoidia bacterium]|nr:hypothetical protein [Dehalococcoidia bacterium]